MPMDEEEDLNIELEETEVEGEQAGAFVGIARVWLQASVAY